MTAAHGALKVRSGQVYYAHYAQEPPHAGACRSSQTGGEATASPEPGATATRAGPRIGAAAPSHRGRERQVWRPLGL